MHDEKFYALINSALSKQGEAIDNLLKYIEILKSDVATAQALTDTHMAALECLRDGAEAGTLLECIEALLDLKPYSNEASNAEIDRLREDNKWCRMAVDSQIEECQRLRKELEEAKGVV